MRKCAYCGMVSHSEDHCDWCKRPYNAFLYAPDRPAARARKKISRKTSNQIKIGILSMITVLALLSFAFQRKTSAPFLAPQAQADQPQHRNGHVSTLDAARGARNDSAGIDSTTSGNPGWDYSPSQASNAQRAPGATLSANAIPQKDQVRLVDVSLNFEHSADDSETGYGKVTIQNLGDHPISDFRMVLNVNDVLTPLVPFEGNINYPMALSSKQIPPHGSLTVAVLTPGHYVATKPAQKHVILEALVHGDSDVILRDEVPTQ